MLNLVSDSSMHSSNSVRTLWEPGLFNDGACTKKYLQIASERYKSQAFSMTGPVQKKYLEIASER